MKQIQKKNSELCLRCVIVNNSKMYGFLLVIRTCNLILPINYLAEVNKLSSCKYMLMYVVWNLILIV